MIRLQELELVFGQTNERTDERTNGRTKVFQEVLADLKRKKVGNPPNYFDKTFAEYQDGFAVNAELNRVDSLMKFFQSRVGLVFTCFI